VLRTYLELVTELPWGKRTEDEIDLVEAEKILDEDHYGLEDVKDRVLEFLAVRKLQMEQAGGGGAGGDVVIAAEDVLSRPFAAEDEDEEKDANGTARPGRATGRREAGGQGEGAGRRPRPDPAVRRAARRGQDVHREVHRAVAGPQVRAHRAGRRARRGGHPRPPAHVRRRHARPHHPGAAAGRHEEPGVPAGRGDKLGVSLQGDPSAALLEVLDPAQNHAFVDHYLGVPFDLSEVLFVATANWRDRIPAPLLDRMETVEFSGYTELEKLEIAKRYLLPRQKEESGLRETQLVMDGRAIERVISEYTREAGVRQLERELGKVARKAARRIAVHEVEQVVIATDDIQPLLGRARVYPERAAQQDTVGTATGMYYTPMGGDIMFVEASASHGKDKLILTGQLGDVMKESARAALTYAKTHHDRLGIPEEAFRTWRSTSTCPRAPSRRTARRPASPWRPPRLRAERPARAQRCRHDRRDHAERPRPAHRRRQGEGARRLPRRHPRGHPAGGQRAAPRRPAGGGPRSRCSSTPSATSATCSPSHCAARRCTRAAGSRIHRRSWSWERCRHRSTAAATTFPGASGSR
jgi:ATP-dependent Lon protease